MDEVTRELTREAASVLMEIRAENYTAQDLVDLERYVVELRRHLTSMLHPCFGCRFAFKTMYQAPCAFCTRPFRMNNWEATPELAHLDEHYMHCKYCRFNNYYNAKLWMHPCIECSVGNTRRKDRWEAPYDK